MGQKRIANQMKYVNMKLGGDFVLKRCNGSCNQVKPVDEFPKCGGGRYRRDCKVCHNMKNKQWKLDNNYQENYREKYREYQKEYGAKLRLKKGGYT